MRAPSAFMQRHAAKLCFAAILLLGAVLRFSHLDIAHFQLDQSRSAQLVWDIARDGQLHAYYFLFTGGYHGFPLPLYLWSPAYFFSSHIHALLIWNIAFGLGGLALTWRFVQRYWSWQAAAIASLLFATAPWHVWYAHRLWSLMQMSPFVMLWLIGTVRAAHEKHMRYWALSWGMAILLVQLHASGSVFVFASGFIWLMSERSWRWAALGMLLAALPALPWLQAHISGEIGIHVERLPFVGEGKSGLHFNVSPLLDFLAVTEWRQWFQGDSARLEQALRPLESLALPLLLALAGGFAFVIRRVWRGPQAAIYRVLALWLILPLVIFPFVTYESNMLVYYYPLLPAPFIGIAMAWQALRPRWKRVAGMAMLCLCAMQAYAVVGSAHVIRSAVTDDSETVWAVGGGAPLSQQLRIADAARDLLDGGDAQELILLIRPLQKIEHEHLAHALPLLAQKPIRVLDASRPHLLFPAIPSALILDRRNTVLPAAYPATEIKRSGPYRLYRLPGGSAPAPETPLPDRPAYANGVALLGYDALPCDAGWRLHWTPGPASADDAARTHFFVSLMGADERILAQQDLAAYDARSWRPGDHIVTTINFDAPMPREGIVAIRVGMYRYSLTTGEISENVYALDENGNPWLYAVDLPYHQDCVE